MAQKYLGSFQILQSYSIKHLRGVESKQITRGRQNSQSCLKLFHVLVAPQVAAVQMAQVCTAGSICLFGGKAVTPLLTGPAEAMLLSVAQKYRQIEGQLINLLATPASLPHSTLTYTWEKMLSNNSDTGFALHTAISKALGCWECFPVLPSLAQGWHWTDHSPTHC